MSQRKLKHMGLEGRNDAIQAAIRSNHLELNMGIPYAATHCGLPPDVCVQHTVGVPSLQSLCRDFLCRNEVPLTRESAPSVDPASVLDVDDLLQDVPSAMRAKMEVCTTPHLDFSGSLDGHIPGGDGIYFPNESGVICFVISRTMSAGKARFAERGHR